MKVKKKFDAVKMMREIRGRLGREMAGMTFAEKKRHIRERLASDRRDGRPG